MSFTITAAGGAGVSSGPDSYLQTSAYNQTAGHCIVVAISSYPNPTSAPTDTAGNTYTKVFVSDIMDAARGVFFMNWYYAKNCKGSTVNQIKFTASGIAYSTMDTWDIADADTSNPLDVAIYNAGTSTTECPIGPYSTTVANEALITWIVQDYGSLPASPTPPSDYIADSYGQLATLTLGASKIVSSLQTSVTDTWTNLTGNDSDYLPGFVLSFKQAASVSNEQSGISTFWT
jgi:hypothetical protein